MAAVTNDHKLGSLKQQNFMLSQLGGEVQNQGVGRAMLPLKALGGDPPHLFQLLGAPGGLGLRPRHPNLCLYLHTNLLSVCVHVFSFSVSTLSLLPSYKDTCDFTEGPPT